MEKVDKVLLGVLGTAVIGGGALMGLSITSDYETNEQKPYTPKINPTKSMTTTTSKPATTTTDPVIEEGPTSVPTQTQINDYWWTETIAVPVEKPMQPAPQRTVTQTVPVVVPTTVYEPAPAPVDPAPQPIPEEPLATTEKPVFVDDPDLGDNEVYKNCRAVWDATGGPISWTDYGYGHHLDRDADGKACEKEPDY